MSRITSHILDTSAGRPASGVRVRLEQRVDGGRWHSVGEAQTDDDGRSAGELRAADTPGVYRLRFDTGPYFAARGEKTFYPEVSVVFEVAAEQSHYHVPLLVSPWGYTTYRGS